MPKAVIVISSANIAGRAIQIRPGQRGAMVSDARCRCRPTLVRIRQSVLRVL